MTSTKTFASKLTVAFVAAAMIVSVFAPAAQAQSADDLQKMINDLLAQVASLQSQVGQGGSSSAAGVCPYTWTRDLSSGSTGADVMKLQQFLNASADTMVAASGVGSVGMETEFYGPATAAAVSKLQMKYRSEILSPANLVNPTGYFGPSTRGKANALCVSAPVVVDDEDDEMEDEDDDFDGELSGEASLDKLEIDSASDDELEEGAEDAEVAEFTIEFTNGDAEISRIDISASSSAGNTETEPWDVFESFSLWIDGDKVAEEDASDEDDYLDEDDGTIRFSGLDIIAMEDEEVEIVLAATLQDNLDGLPEGWEFAMETIRFFDADGVATTENAPTLELGDAETITIQEEGTDDELIAKTSSNDPDASTLQVEDDKKSDWYTVFVFDLDTDDSINDIEIDSIKINASTTIEAYNTLVDDVEIVIDGVTIDDVTVANGASTAIPAVLTFDVDGDVVIDAGDRVEVEVMMRFKALDSSDEGATVKLTIDSLTTSIVSAEGADDLDNTQLSGSATGETHTLRTAGADISPVSVDAEVTTSDGNFNDYGEFEIEFEVTAFEQDVYVPIATASSVSYVLQDGSGSTSGNGTRSVTLTSTADEGGASDAFFEVTEGSTETFTLTVTYTPGVANTATRLVLNSITFDATGTATNADDQTQVTVPASDYRTGIVTIVN